MTEWTLTKTRLLEGVWEGILLHEGGSQTAPRVIVTHLQEPLGDVNVSDQQEGGGWVLRVPVPADRISDGVQTFVISDAVSEEVLDSFTIIAGDALAYDIRAEVTLLREELDMLKRAFRRHCLDTI